MIGNTLLGTREEEGGGWAMSVSTLNPELTRDKTGVAATDEGVYPTPALEMVVSEGWLTR